MEAVMRLGCRRRGLGEQLCRSNEVNLASVWPLAQPSRALSCHIGFPETMERWGIKGEDGSRRALRHACHAEGRGFDANPVVAREAMKGAEQPMHGAMLSKMT